MNESERKHRYLYVAIGLVMVLLAVGLFFRLRRDANLRHVRDLQRAMANASLQEREPMRQQFRDAMQRLAPSQRQALGEEGRRRFEQSIVNYTKLSKEEKARYLDQQIDRMQQFQRPQNNNTFAAPPQNRPPSSSQDRERRRRERLDHSTPEFRAAMDQFRKDMEARRNQRGLPPGGRR
jgi:hypothetical protein